MEHVSIQLDSSMARQMERDMREFNYGTKTEFIRASIRSKLKEHADERERKKAWQALFAARGIFKGKGKAKTDEEWDKIREETSRELLKHYEKKFGLKPA